MKRFLYHILSLGLPFALPVHAQFASYRGEVSWQYYGYALGDAGDVDGDGVPDIVVGAPRTSAFACGGATSFADVRSGRTGQRLYSFVLDVGEHHGALVQCAGDVNIDGRADLLVANSPDPDCAFQTTATVYSGATGSVLHTIQQPTWGELYNYQSDKALAALGDVDGDGNDDFVLAEPEHAGSRGRAVVYSGRTGEAVFTLVGDNPFDRVGQAVSGVGDWNGDGRPDCAIGSGHWTRIYSVADQSLLQQYERTGRLAVTGDLDSDGQVDIMVSGRVLSGADGSTLLDLPGWTRQSVAVDFDADGRRDFLVADPSAFEMRGQVALLSGRDAGLLAHVYTGLNPGDQAGHEIAVIGLSSASGAVYFAVGAPFEDNAQLSDAGALHLFRAPCFSQAPTNYCIAAPNSAGLGAVMGYDGSWSITANDLRLTATGCPPNHFGLFYYGPNQVQLPFGNGFRCVGGPIQRLTPATSTGVDGVAHRDLDFYLPPLNAGSGAILPGHTAHFQFWYRDVPGGGAFFNLSDGLTIVFCH